METTEKVEIIKSLIKDERITVGVRNSKARNVSNSIKGTMKTIHGERIENCIFIKSKDTEHSISLPWSCFVVTYIIELLNKEIWAFNCRHKDNVAFLAPFSSVFNTKTI